ncbi:MAG: rod shape-determining protein MreC [Candidatus Faecousia sp.]|nr:rod shape-determining protein MreC [Clostridiales bacterium]MDD6297069.1 rod shape-determining protein MreC [Bacillota bacterium]MDD7341636.1 rod shape-determining protein MreC [Bacillota bacterium]MDY2809113.1 rod shape-determining protein MreC [Candidatus Faecousia sp.]
MKRFFSSKVRTVLVIAVVLAAALTVIGNLTGSTPLDGVVKGLMTPISTAASHLKNGAAQLYSYLFRYEALAAENADLKEQLAQISNDARKLDAMTRENARLRAALELQQDHEDYKLVDAYIIDRDSQDWASTFTINRGSAAGIAEGMCVVTENGEVVGLITSVGSNYAVVTTVLDSSLEVSATIASTGYNGMVRGGYTVGLDGYLRMDYLPTSAVIRNQDQVVTSGSTVYPRDLVLGRIIDAGYDDTGVAKYAVLEPAVNVSSIEQVFVITEYDAG